MYLLLVVELKWFEQIEQIEQILNAFVWKQGEIERDIIRRGGGEINESQ